MKVLFYGLKGAGHFNPTLPVVGALVERGHEVAYCTTIEWQPTIEAAGVRFLNVAGTGPFTTSNYHPDPNLPLQIVPATAAIASEVVEQARAWGPDVIVHDGFAMWGRLVARVLEVPSVSSVTTLVIADPADVDAPAERVDTDPLNVEAARSLDARFGEHPSWGDPSWTFGEDAMVYSCAELNPGAESLATRLHYVGSPVVDADGSAALAAHELSHVGKDRPLVIVALGTLAVRVLGLDAAFFRPFVEAFAARPDVDLVISVGSSLDPELLEPLPANVRVHRHVPQVALLERASVFFSHAGANSLHEALHHGVPLVCIPCFADQFFNARRVEAVGAGVVLQREDVDVESVGAAFERVRSDATFRQQARRLSRALRAGGGAQRAADVIERVARRAG